jgi:hypothetical protein
MIVKCSESDVMEGDNGGCTACGNIQYGGVEPDAQQYECECCGEHTVFGLEELLIMDLIKLTGDIP